MSDWPNAGRQGAWQGASPAASLYSHGAGSGAGSFYTMFESGVNPSTQGAWPTANKAWYMPVYVERPVTVYQMSVYIGTSSGNLDLGIYDEFGTRLVSLGSTASPGALVQTFNITDTPLVPGTYYLALAADNTTITFRRGTTPAAAVIRTMGVHVQTSAFPLPNPTATFAVADAAYVPLIVAHLAATV